MDCGHESGKIYNIYFHAAYLEFVLMLKGVLNMGGCNELGMGDVESGMIYAMYIHDVYLDQDDSAFNFYVHVVADATRLCEVLV
eukprot:CAMPEP_0170589788 /NCGR_PEP_ID=MMETSP0224-20130122/11527_1 /TAXON_ID=285029 /ORGANISM="Togula jolla, Strain CCCM 725" /LENGTH=83 /DNA_ID=CAMNT_0010913549 /DNA_START=44 /DNA_END=295 /DNA_ORIENTATION=+